MGNNLAVYTAIFGNRDEYAPPVFRGSFDAFLFTDRKVQAPEWVNVVFVDTIFSQRDERRTARAVKILGHPALKGYSRTLWLDGSMDPGEVDLCRFANMALAPETDVAVFRHPKRNCLYEEAKSVIRSGLDDSGTVLGQIGRYRSGGFPKWAGLAATGIVAWRESDATNRFRQHWWGEVRSGSVRDQISFPYAALKLKVRVRFLPWPTRPRGTPTVIFGIAYRRHSSG